MVGQCRELPEAACIGDPVMPQTLGRRDRTEEQKEAHHGQSIEPVAESSATSVAAAGQEAQVGEEREAPCQQACVRQGTSMPDEAEGQVVYDEWILDEQDEQEQVRELRQQAETLLDALVLLEKQHRRDVVDLEGRLAELVSGNNASQASATPMHAGYLPLVFFGASCALLATFGGLAKSVALNRHALATSDKLLVWAASRGPEVPNISGAVPWSAASYNVAGFVDTVDASSLNSPSSLFIVGVVRFCVGLIHAVIEGLFRGLAQGVFAAVALPVIMLCIVWLLGVGLAKGASNPSALLERDDSAQQGINFSASLVRAGTTLASIVLE